MGGFLKNESLRRLEQDQRTGRPAGQQSGAFRLLLLAEMLK